MIGVSATRVLAVAALALGACGGHNTPKLGVDGSSDEPDAPAAGSDAPAMYPACAEFASAPAGVTLPAHVTGRLAGADVESPSSCTEVDAPFGIVSPGPDSVVRLDGLTPGQKYVVKLASDSDLAFYVVTGCSTPTGPSAAQCALFVDASKSGELGTFTATAATEFVVVDYWQTSAPDDPNWTLDVYADACDDASACTTAGLGACLDHRCVQCAGSFDCTDPANAVCDTSHHTCGPGTDSCTSDDAAEPGDDGPAGATVLSSGAPVSAHVCSVPRSEADYYAFDVTAVGQLWTVQLAWGNAQRDLDLELYDASGAPIGFSLWERPEQVQVAYLPPGRYYARVTEYAGSTGIAAPASYTIEATRQSGGGCVDADDCAAVYRNQIYRGACVAGSCVAIDGGGAVPQGGHCDSQSDCAPGLHCPSFYFVEGADTRDTCQPECTNDAMCGPGQVCTTYLSPNFCVDQCTDSRQCATAPDEQPQSGPWVQLTCELSTGRCLP